MLCGSPARLLRVAYLINYHLNDILLIKVSTLSTCRLHLLLVDSGKHHGHDGRDRRALLHRTPGDNQLHPVATLPQDLGHLFAAHPIQVSVTNPQDVVPAAQATILQEKRFRSVENKPLMTPPAPR